MSQALLNRAYKTLNVEHGTSYIHVGRALTTYLEVSLKVEYENDVAYMNNNSCVEYFAKENGFKLSKTIKGTKISAQHETEMKTSNKYLKFNIQEFIVRNRLNTP